MTGGHIPDFEDNGAERPLPDHFDWPDWYPACHATEAHWLFQIGAELVRRESRLNTEYRPRAFQEPTLASGSNASPPAGTSDDGVADYRPSRMGMNGETYLGGERQSPAFTPDNNAPFHGSEITDA